MTTATSIDLELAGLLADCALAGRSGLLTAVRGKLKRLFCLEDGHLVLALSNVIEEQFSEILVRDELLSVGDLAGARQVCEQRSTRLSRLLVDEEIVSEEAMSQAIEAHVRELLFATLEWTDGEASFDVGRPDLEGEIRVRLAAAPLLFEYVGRPSLSLDELRSRLGSTSNALEVHEKRAVLLADHDPGPDARHLLARFDGETSAEVLVGECPGGSEGGWRALYALRMLRLAEPSAKERAGAEEIRSRDEIEAEVQRVENADHYRVLSVPPHAAPERIRDAYYVLARRYHPDRFRSGPLQDLRERVEGYFVRVTEAYNTLYDSRLRAAYDEQRLAEQHAEPEQDTAYLARENYRRGKALLAKGRFQDAVTSLENAVNLQERNATYRLELGRLQARNPRLRSQAEQHLKEVNRIDPALVDGYLTLGELYLRTQRTDQAIDLFREVLRWEAGHLEATDHLRELGAL